MTNTRMYTWCVGHLSMQGLALTHAACAGQNGWPTSSVVPGIPQDDEEKTLLIDTLQDWKSAKYREIVCKFSRVHL